MGRGSRRQGWQHPRVQRLPGSRSRCSICPGHGAEGSQGGDGGKKVVGKGCPFPGSPRKRWAKPGSLPGGVPWTLTRGEAGAWWPQRGPRCWPETSLEGGRGPGMELVGEGGWPGCRHPSDNSHSPIFCPPMFFRAAAPTRLPTVPGAGTRQRCGPARPRSPRSLSGPGPAAATEPVCPQSLVTAADTWGHRSSDRKGTESS